MKRGDIHDRMVCIAYAEAWRAGCPCSVEVILKRMTGAPAKVITAAMVRACGRGYVDYGVSLRCGWLTDKGRALVA